MSSWLFGVATLVAGLLGPAPPASVSGAVRVGLVGPAPTPRLEWSLPIPPSSIDRAALRAPHHDYPASDLLVPEGTPLFAVHAGEVSLHSGPRCGVGLTLRVRRLRFVYCHLRDTTVGPGAVRAADVVGLSGESGNATGVPHLHLHVLDGAGRYVCPQALLTAWFDGRRPPAAAWARRTGCFFERGVAEGG